MELGGWAGWDETSYQKHWNTIVGVRAIAYDVLGVGMTKPVFDLAMETPGTGLMADQFVHRVWSDYSATFGTSDTIGASIIASPYTLHGIAAFGSVRPERYAFDIYGADVGAALAEAHAALGVEGSKPIIITETWFNDSTTASQISGFLASNPSVNVETIVHWPLTRDPPCSGCGDVHVHDSAINAQNTTSQLSNVSAMLSKVGVENTDPARLIISDVNCETTSGVCTVQGAFGPTQSLKRPIYIVTVRMNDGPRTVWVCNAGNTTATFPWTQRNKGWHFEYHAVTSCSDDVANARVGASAHSYLSVRH